MMAIGKPNPPAWNRKRMTKTHRKGKATAKRNTSRAARIEGKTILGERWAEHYHEKEPA